MGSVSSTVATQNDGIADGRRPQKPLLLPHPRVQTTKGLLEGFRHQLADGRPVNVFLGVSYARPPVGELRFQKPVEEEAWHPAVRLAKKLRQRSIQMNFLHVNVAERRAGKSEDCLWLNVIAPGWKCADGTGGGFPVMFYIHGGGYLMDSAVKYGYQRIARSLVRHGVVVVLIQYRLGLLGFFSTGDSACPGNWGLWDQLAALRWTRENIGAFGGDPARITLMGQSAGAASADLLGLCPLSRDLFSQAILMGGNAECSWALAAREHIVPFCRRWALKLGFRSEQEAEDGADWSPEENARMMAFLRAFPAYKFEVNLLGVARQLFDTLRLPLGPVVDGQLIPCSPKLLRTQCPPKRFLAGVCRHEGMLFIALAMRRAGADLLTKLECKIQSLLDEARVRSASDARAQGKDPPLVAKVALRELYGIEEAMRTSKSGVEHTCVKLLSDFMANIALHNFCLHSQRVNGSTVFRYQLQHHNPDNTRALNPLMAFPGATHSTELAFVLDANMFVLPWRRTAADKRVLDLVTKMWTNFAKCGHPNGVVDGNGTEVKEMGDRNNNNNNNNNRNHSAVDGKDGSAHQPLLPRWDPVDQQNLERHLSIEIQSKMLLESASSNGGDDEAVGQRRIERLADAYRMCVQ